MLRRGAQHLTPCRWPWLSFVLLAGVAVATPAHAQTAPTTIPWIGAPQVRQPLDSLRFDPPAPALHRSLAFEVSPRTGTPNEAWPTRVAVFHDGQTLYVVVDARDPQPQRITAQQGPHDTAASTGDAIVLQIDAEGMGRRAFEFTVNAAGATADSVISSSGQAAPYWTGRWQARAWRTETGWGAEFTVPLATLGLADGRATVAEPTHAAAPRLIGLNVQRQIGRERAEVLALAPIDSKRPCIECQFEKFALGTVAPASGRWSLAPYAAIRGSRSRSSSSAGGPADTASQREAYAGLDMKWESGSGQAFLAAIRPDFSQLDVDALQITVNRRFALTLPENRPFFSHSAGHYPSPMPLVYTRAITDLDAAAQYLQKSSGSTLGVMLARDRFTNIVMPGVDSSRLVSKDAPSTSLALKVGLDADQDLTKGLLLTARQSGGYRSVMAAADLAYRFDDRNRVIVQLGASSTRDVQEAGGGGIGMAAAPGTGHAAHVAHEYGSADTGLFHMVRYTESSAGFRADLGRLDQVGVRQLQEDLGWSVDREPDAFFTRYGLSASAGGTQAAGGRLLARATTLLATLVVRGVNDLGLAHTRAMQVAGGVALKDSTTVLSLVSTPIDRVTLLAELGLGEQPDYAALATRSSRTRRLSVLHKPWPWLSWRASLRDERLRGIDGAGYTAAVSNVAVEWTPNNAHRLAANLGGSRLHERSAREATHTGQTQAQVTYTYRPGRNLSFVCGGVYRSHHPAIGADTSRSWFSKLVLDQ